MLQYPTATLPPKGAHLASSLQSLGATVARSNLGPRPMGLGCYSRSPPPQLVLWIALFILIEGSASAATVPGAGPVVLAGPASATPLPPLALRQLRLSVHRSG